MKKILTIIAALVVVILLAAALAPKEFKIEREIVINKSPSEVFSYLKMTKNSNEWSPWMKKDPKMTQTYKGEDGKVGFVTSWTGNSEVGTGEEEITSISENERIDMELRFEKPMKATNKSYFIVHKFDKDQTRVVWGMTGRTPFPMNLVCLFMHGKVSDTFGEGLANLKAVLEKK